MLAGKDLVAAINAEVEGSREAALTFLGQIVDLQGGSEDRNAVNRVGDVLADALSRIGFGIQRFAASPYGDHLVLRNHDHTDAVVLVGHMDTTFVDYADLPPFHLDGARAVGPGTADMRGGLVVIRYALECLQRLGLLVGLPVTVVFNSDEERGSTSSRSLFDEVAREARCALVFECGGKDGEVVIGRRGKLSFRLHVEGRAGHAATRGAKKASAILETAHKVIAIEALNDQRQGTTFNVGKIQGGIAGNTFPREARIECDIRYLHPEDRVWIEETIAEISRTCRETGCRSTHRWTSERPVWQPGGEGQNALIATLQQSARQLGIPFGTEFRWGTSDASFLADRGVATVDGLGPIGFEDHSEREHILIETLFERIRLTALALTRL